METWKDLLKWQYIIPCILFIFSSYGWYIKTNSEISDLSVKVNELNKNLLDLQSTYGLRFNHYDIDIAVIKQDNGYIKNSQDVIIRKLDDYTYKKN